MLRQVIVGGRQGLARRGDFPRESILDQLLLGVVEDSEAQPGQFLAGFIELTLQVLDPQVFLFYVKARHGKSIAVQTVERDQVLGQVPRGRNFAGGVTDREGEFCLVIARRIYDKLFKGTAIAACCQGLFLSPAGEGKAHPREGEKADDEGAG